MNNRFYFSVLFLVVSIFAYSQERISESNYLDKGIITTSDDTNPTLKYLNDKSDTTFYVVNDASSWVKIEFAEPIVISSYTLVSSFDALQDPQSWSLEYSDDGLAWTLLHTKNESFPQRNYPLNNRTGLSGGSQGHKYYRFSFTSSGSQWGVAELQAFGSPQTFQKNITSNGGILTGEYPGLPAYGETLEMLVDNTYKKFCQTDAKSFWVEYESSVPVFLEKYAITTAYSATRMPRTWQLLGSNDGVTYDLLDYQKNKNLFEAPYATHIYEINSAITPSPDWAKCADLTYEALMTNYWRNYSKGGYYFMQKNGDDPHLGYNYWWMAHGLDVFVDGYARTGKAAYKNRMNQLDQGIMAYGNNSYWNTFYDDMEWMGLACLRAYEATGENRYKTRAIELWDWIKGGWSDVSYGGIAWAAGSPNSKNACSNGPAMILAARLYNVTGNEEYLNWAKKIYNWMNYYIVDATTGYVWDAYNNFNVSNVYTYNIGTWMGGCLELYLITGEQRYLDKAVLSANCVVNSLDKFSPYGILYNNENGGDGGLFKGIFMRYLSQMIMRGNLDADLRNTYIDYFRDNGLALWNSATLKPEMIVSKKWFERPDAPEQDCSIQLSGVMLFELLDELKRKGFMPDKSEVIAENSKNSYKKFRLGVLINNGDTASELGEWQLFGSEDTGIESELFGNSLINVSGANGQITLMPQSDLNYSYKIFDVAGLLQASGKASDAAIISVKSAGVYIVQLQVNNSIVTKKVLVRN